MGSTRCAGVAPAASWPNPSQNYVAGDDFCDEMGWSQNSVDRT